MYLWDFIEKREGEEKRFIQKKTKQDRSIIKTDNRKKGNIKYVFSY